MLWGARRGPQARAYSLRADARQALERLAAAAQCVARRDPVEGSDLRAPLDMAAFRLRVYCQYLQRELSSTLASRGAFGMVTASYLKHFEQHQCEEIAELTKHLERAPRSAGVAHGVFVTAVMLIAELDAHGRDVASVLSNEVEA
jgi:hypothetical protein